MPTVWGRLVSAIAAVVLPFVWGAAAMAAEPTEPATAGNASFAIDFVYATRDVQGSEVILQDTVTSASVLTTDDFDSRWAAGADARLTLGGPEHGLVLRFLGGFDWHETTSFTTPAIWNFPTNPPLFGLGVAATSDAIDTRLNSFEANFTWDMGQQSILFVGVRDLVLDDKLTVVADFGGNVATVTSEASTNGIGPQIGAQKRFGDSAFIDVDLRAALLFTQSNLDFGVVQAIGPAFSADGDPDSIAGAFEAGIAAGMKVGPSTTLRIGYRALYVTNMPSGASNLSSVDVLNAAIAHTSQAFLVHAVTFGLVTVF